MRFAWTAALLAVVVGAPLALAEDRQATEEQPHARVVVSRTTVRAGPSGSERALYEARRGEVFPVEQRGTRGYWFAVRMTDGVVGYVEGGDVYVFDPAEEPEAALPGEGPFAPPPVVGARVELSVAFGVLTERFGADGLGGLFAVRPGVLLAPAFALEASGLVALDGPGRLYAGGLGALVNLAPRAPAVPFLVAGGGWGYAEPNDDALLEAGSWPYAFGGAGLRLGFRGPFVVRLDLRAHLFFLDGTVEVREEISVGVSVFF